MTDREKRNPDSRGEVDRRLLIGVLALQGDFAMHEAALARVPGVTTRQVRKPEDLEGLDGLVVPGGESTTLLKLIDAWGFVPALEKFHAAGRPIFGTCAGLILLARDVDRPKQFSLGLIDVGVERNAYGRQRESFVAQGAAHLEDRTRPLEMVFIRAPRITRLGSDVQPLATHADDTVMARQGTVLVATFHPELTTDPAVHEYFCRMVASAKGT
jgi:5'-phosphate synthase pdxT subunit